MFLFLENGSIVNSMFVLSCAGNSLLQNYRLHPARQRRHQSYPVSSKYNRPCWWLLNYCDSNAVGIDTQEPSSWSLGSGQRLADLCCRKWTGKNFLGFIWMLEPFISIHFERWWMIVSSFTHIYHLHMYYPIPLFPGQFYSAQTFIHSWSTYTLFINWTHPSWHI